jgi:hypothetical protein
MAVAGAILILAWFVGMSFYIWADISECCRDMDDEA